MTLKCDAEDCPFEGKPQDRRELTFPIAMDRIVMWLIAGLVAWLCVSTMSLRENMAVVIERGLVDKQERAEMQRQMHALANTDVEHSDRIKSLEINAAAHGWKEK